MGRWYIGTLQKTLAIIVLWDIGTMVGYTNHTLTQYNQRNSILIHFVNQIFIFDIFILK